jgi:hypothetical protein
MVIGPYSARYGAGFTITMKPDVARRVNAPQGSEFQEMLNRQLAVERSHGHDYCPNGYEIVRTIYSNHWYTEVWVDCK